LNPGPSGEDAETSANLAMSDHPSRAARRMDRPTSGLEAFLLIIAVPSSSGANVA
jgi:hypothetical protein